jgi:hypothetical protein
LTFLGVERYSAFLAAVASVYVLSWFVPSSNPVFRSLVHGLLVFSLVLWTIGKRSAASYSSRLLVARKLLVYIWFAYGVVYLVVAEPNPRGRELHIDLVHGIVLDRDWFDRVGLQFEIIGIVTVILPLKSHRHPRTGVGSN